MKRFLSFLIITVAVACAMQASQVTVSEARQVADQFLKAKSTRLSAPAGHATMSLAYTAEAGRFYIFNRGEDGGYVIVAGDDRLPQVLGYSLSGTFTPGNIPPGMQDWMAEMNREIAYLAAHKDTPVHQPVKRETTVPPLMTTLWNQEWPYNLYCPTYTVGSGEPMRAVTGCIATAMAQIMNYHQWPERGTGSHSYQCNVNGTDFTTLSADFSQSVYEWDKMLDTYDQNSSEESCAAVARLMSDCGISVDMSYGNSSGASETDVLTALSRYFGYSGKQYLLQRDLFGAAEWDQLLVDELSAQRPVLYCGYAYSQGSLGGHAFVFDGYDGDGYFHVNWGWGGHYDNYFLVSVLAPSSDSNFKYGQDAIFGIAPPAVAADVPDVLYIRGLMQPDMYSVPRGEIAKVKFSEVYVQGNLVDTVGYDNMGYWSIPYDTIPMELRVIDQDGINRQSYRFTYKVLIDSWWSREPSIDFIPDESLADGEYKIKIAYSTHKDGNYDSWVCDDYGNDAYCDMLLKDGMVYMSDCTLASKYFLISMTPDQSIFANETFDVDVTLSYPQGYGPAPAPTTGNVHLSLMKDGHEVATSDPLTISLAYGTSATYTLQMMAPSEWGRYRLMLVDESGRRFSPDVDWIEATGEEGIMNIIVVPKSDELVEDFETMTANSSTSDKNVQGRFTSWSFNKSGVRAPGEGKCYGTNSVMMKKPSTFYSVEPVSHHIFMAAATFFNNSSTDAKFTLEFSLDNAETWVKALTIDDTDAAIVPATSATQVIWQLNLSQRDQVLFRIAMTGGGSAAAYVDDFILRYKDSSVAGDANFDGEVNIADVNAIIDMVINDIVNLDADVNGDGEINIADVNAVIDIILGS